MRRITVNKWDAKDIDGKPIKESTLELFKVLISSKPQAELPKGLDYFRTFNRLSKAFDEAEKSDQLVLEETDYTFLKKLIEKDIPSHWAMNKDIFNAVESFLNAPECTS
jgi:hypothetical protein